MQFGELPVSKCTGCILAHSQVIGSKRIAKGTVLDTALIEKFLSNGYKSLTVARLEAGDIEENAAAEKLAKAFGGNGTRLEKAHTGRVNIYASVDGLLEFDRASIIATNSISSGITIAVVAPDQWVLAGRMIASAKIIPYAVPSDDIDQAISVATAMHVHPPISKSAVLIQTTLASIKTKALEKTERITEQRLEARSSSLLADYRCDHQIDKLSQMLAKASESKPDIILIVGASAISDACDVIPAAVEKLGGQVRRVGLPVDPGNLLMLAEYNGVPVLGLPGCARSPKYNGFDLLLDRIVCNVEITDDWLSGLCIGGLFSEAHDRPQPRVAVKSEATSANRVAAIVLAAGSSRRAGSENKLLHLYNSKPMICTVVESVLASKVSECLVVTGHQSDQVANAVEAYDIPVCYCPRHTDGMAHTLAAGLSRLQHYDAVIVCLGDMPHVTTDVIDRIISSQQGLADKIVVPVHKGVRGNPVMFGRTFYDTLLQHEGDSGARFLIKQYPEKVIEIETGDASVLKDYDTLESLRNLGSE